MRVQQVVWGTTTTNLFKGTSAASPRNLSIHGNHTLISTSVLTHTLEDKPGVINTLQHRVKEVPATTQETKNRNTSKQHWEHVATQTGPSPRPPGNEKKRRKKEEDRNNRHSISIPYMSGVLKDLGGILQKHDILVRFKPSNTLKQRLVTPRTKQQDSNKAMSPMPNRARRNAINCTLGKLNSLSINERHNTDVPLPQDKTQQDTYTWKKADTPLMTTRCVYGRAKIAGLKGVSKRHPR